MKIKVLDHGFVELQNIAGPTRRVDNHYDASSIDPANSARMSFGQKDSGRTVEQDLKLVRYLMANHHWTPVEMIEVWLEMKLPIFVARQFVRHRTACLNEISGRYVELPAEFYIPDNVGSKPTNGAKQGQGLAMQGADNEAAKSVMRESCLLGFASYRTMLGKGVAPEHARMVLPLNTYTHWLWKQDLRNMLGFLELRLDSHAQVEARVYACAILELLKHVVPEIMDIWQGIRK